MAQIAKWDLTVERQLGSNWVARAAYAGNKGTHLSTAVDGGANEANPALYIPGNSTPDNTQDRRINPNFGSVGVYGSLYNSNYNALQLNVENHVSRNFSVLANYAWSKMIDDFGPFGGINTNPFNPRQDRAASNDDVTQVFHFSGIWQTPKFDVGRLAGGFLNSWEATSIITWRSGFPFQVYCGCDQSFSGIGLDRADFIGTSISQARVNPNRSHGQLIQQYFNPTVFAQTTALGTFGSSGRNILRGPGFFNTDFGLVKNLHFNERLGLQFRAEFFNFFNNVNFSQPDNSLADSTVGQIFGAGSPRTLQFALKVSF